MKDSTREVLELAINGFDVAIDLAELAEDTMLVWAFNEMKLQILTELFMTED